jgi:hypothetical protein
MKSIANQYKDLKEGKMSQANFMRNLRMSMPQVTNVMSFGDAVKVLKNKGIITESYDNQVGQSFDLDVKSERGDGSVQNYQLKNVKLVNANGRIFEKPDGTTVTLAPSDKYTSTKVDTTTENNEYSIPEVADKDQDNRYNSLVSTNRGEDKDFAKLSRDEKEKMMYADTDPNIADPINDSDAEFDAMLKQIEDEMAGEEAINAQYDETLNEAKEKTNPNKVHPQEYTMGMKYELKCFKGDVVKAERAVLKNLTKEPFYYTALKLSGKDIYKEAPSVKEEAPKKKSKKKEVELVDTINAMQKVKIPKKEEKKKLKENADAPHSIKADQEIDKSELNFLKKAYADRSTDKIPEKSKKIMQDLEDRIAAREKNEAMRFQDLPADPEKYKIVRDSKNYIIKATNADGAEFQKGDTAKTYDGEEIKIVKFEESQGKVKAIYNKGMFFAGIDIDGLEAPKPTMRPGVDMGSSFEKMKAKLAEMVKKAMAEFYDGRDNLTNISDDTK